MSLLPALPPIIISFKYCDTAILSLLNGNNLQPITTQIPHFTQCCTGKYLQLNMDKTKQLTVDIKHTPHCTETHSIHGWTVEQQLTSLLKKQLECVASEFGPNS